MSIADRIIARLREDSVVRQVNTPPDLHPESDPNRRRTLVIAGNYRQACEFAREAGWKKGQWIFISRPSQFRGFRPHTTLAIFYGTWYEHRDTAEVYWLARSGGFTIVE